MAQRTADDLQLDLIIDPDALERRDGVDFERSAPVTTTMTDASERPLGERRLRLVEGFARQLFATPEGDPGAALAHLLDVLGARGGSLIEELEDGRRVVLAARGRGALDALAGTPPSPPCERLAATGEDRYPCHGEFTFSSDGNQTMACLRGRESPRLAIVVRGDFAGRADSEILFRVLLRFLDRWRPPASRHAGGTACSTDPRGATCQGNHLELTFPDDYLVGTSPPMRALFQQMRALRKGDMPVLIVGETGVGKERLASILHHSSDLRDGPLVAINCAAIPADLLEAELFGIGKGVATGVDKRAGKFQLAAGGTLFLDEIGEMQPHLQSKLLRALEEKQIQPIGDRPRRFDSRIVAATNADLGRRMERGEFRRDLYYRLAGFVLEVPALRECPDDIPPLVEHFVRAFAGRAGIRVRGVTGEALRLLASYSWPGNVRELQHEIRRLVYLGAERGVIEAALISSHIAAANPFQIGLPEAATSKTLLLSSAVHRLEARFIREALRRTGGRQVHAARLLGISRNGLADKLKRLGIDPQTHFAKTSRRDS